MTIIIWMKITNNSLLRPLIEGPNKYPSKDKTYTVTANTVTMSKFGPSGSLRNEKNALEHTIAVIPNISNEVFFDLKSIVNTTVSQESF